MLANILSLILFKPCIQSFTTTFRLSKMASPVDFEDIIYTDCPEEEQFRREMLKEHFTFLPFSKNHHSWDDAEFSDLEYIGAQAHIDQLVDKVRMQLNSKTPCRLSVCIFQDAITYYSNDDIIRRISFINETLQDNPQHFLVFGTIWYPPDRQDLWSRIRDLNDYILDINSKNETIQLMSHHFPLKWNKEKCQVDLRCWEKGEEGYQLSVKGHQILYKGILKYHKQQFDNQNPFNKRRLPTLKIPDEFDLKEAEEMRAKTLAENPPRNSSKNDLRTKLTKRSPSPDIKDTTHKRIKRTIILNPNPVSEQDSRNQQTNSGQGSSNCTSHVTNRKGIAPIYWCPNKSYTLSMLKEKEAALETKQALVEKGIELINKEWRKIKEAREEIKKEKFDIRMYKLQNSSIEGLREELQNERSNIKKLTKELEEIEDKESEIYAKTEEDLFSSEEIVGMIHKLLKSRTKK